MDFHSASGVLVLESVYSSALAIKLHSYTVLHCIMRCKKQKPHRKFPADACA